MFVRWHIGDQFGTFMDVVALSCVQGRLEVWCIGCKRGPSQHVVEGVSRFTIR